jgi:hypothetical protein
VKLPNLFFNLHGNQPTYRKLGGLKMCRSVSVILLFLCLSAIVGCATLFSKQEWSENYTQLEGVRATNPAMIDGNVKTPGETVFPESVYIAASPPSEAIITLPEKKLIRRMVVYSDNLKTFDVFADKGGIGLQQTDWQLIKEVKSASKSPISLMLPLSFKTDQIRIRVLSTTDDASMRRKQRARTGGGGGGLYRTGNRRAVGKIYEIELYGYKSTEDAQAQAEVEKQEDELDQLLK